MSNLIKVWAVAWVKEEQTTTGATHIDFDVGLCGVFTDPKGAKLLLDEFNRSGTWKYRVVSVEVDEDTL